MVLLLNLKLIKNQLLRAALCSSFFIYGILKMKKIFALNLVIMCSHTVFAAPNDIFIMSKEFKNSVHKLNTTISYDIVNDTVDIFDIRAKEGVTQNNVGDYDGFNLTGKYNINSLWSIETGYWNRNIEYNNEKNEINSGLIATRFSPNLNLNQNDHLSFRVSLWGNQASQLNKSTLTEVNGNSFQGIQVIDPKDMQMQLDVLYSKKLDFMNQLNLITSIGYSKVEIEKLKIQATKSGCLINIDIDKDNRYISDLAKPCSNNNITVDELHNEGDAEEFGLAIDQDLNYDSYYLALGGSWNFRYKQFESQLAYQYQRIWRKDIDDRVSNFGNIPIKDNHIFGAKFSYDIRPNIALFLKGELYQHNFIGTIPFLYNAVTSSSLDKRYGLASLGITLHSF